mmetsp:Transcript_28332/g.37828  ORF Transcript_28332/g.37828 Transcript_28332/m.37828 type:complete len:109 (-) Transcript_28332:1468-1794(-)
MTSTHYYEKKATLNSLKVTRANSLHSPVAHCSRGESDVEGVAGGSLGSEGVQVERRGVHIGAQMTTCDVVSHRVLVAHQTIVSALDVFVSVPALQVLIVALEPGKVLS